MNDAQWLRQWEIFDAALSLDASERTAFIEGECDGDAELLRDIEQLVHSHLQSSVLLDGDAVEWTLPASEDGDGDELRLGPYRIERVIGEGGMGTVYLAHQDQPIRREVALKVIRFGMSGGEAGARFESERQTLAMMNHPGIASVFDCGAFPDGRPFLAMERVEGEPLIRFADAHGLGVEERLELFKRLCDAVEHAHRKGVVHRDLKPSNVLVANAEGGPVVKVIDFGIAKAVAPDVLGDAPETRAGSMVGTPEYMSPEQAKMSSDVDTQSDVYALGVLLYELLSGRRPFDFAGKTHAEIQQILCDTDPPVPSQARRELKGDLDWVVMRALEKDRVRRYGSVAELSADLQRFRRDEPVSVGPPGTAYRVGKFVKRHRTAAIAGAAVTAALLVGIVLSAWFAVIARDERAAAEAARAEAEASRDIAREEADRAQTTNELLFDMLRSPDPTRPTMTDGEARDVKVIDVLARASAGAADSPPELAANVHELVGRMYLRLGLYPDAEAELQMAHAGRREVYGADHPNTLSAAHNLAAAIENGGRLEESISAYRDVLDARVRVLGAEHRDTLITQISLANALVRNDDLEAAEPMFASALEAAERVLGPTDDNTLGAVTGLGFVRNRRGDGEAAERLYRRAYEGRLDTLGPDHPGTLTAMNNLAAVLQSLERFEEAEALYGDMVERFSRVLGPEHAGTLNAISNFGALLFRQGKPAEAEIYFRRAAEINERVLGPAHPRSLIAANNMIRAMVEQGRHEEAAAAYEVFFPRAFETYPPEHVNLGLFRGGYGELLTVLERYPEAEAELLAALASLQAAAGEQHPQTISQARRLVALYEAWGQPEKAAEFRALLPAR